MKKPKPVPPSRSLNEQDGPKRLPVRKADGTVEDGFKQVGAPKEPKP